MKIGQIVAVAVVLVIAATAANAQRGIDFAISGAGVFSKTTSSASGGITNTPTKSVAVFGTVRYHFAKRHAVEVNLGHTHNSQIFSIPPDSYRVVTGIGEYSAAYVFTPLQGKRFQPFLLAGGGALKFGVGNTYIDNIQQFLGANSRTSLAFLYGAGTDYHLWKFLALRLQYRGLIYRSPDYGAPTRFYTGARGHLAEPSVGIVVKF
ncbi:MAG TPA: outer membrane beta-barrel protein [Terriglobales bacterium]|nr:outer membrane beta-barrel protein [Terriglobales bacterium]